MKELSIENKELLLKDLCARLPYKVECEAILNNGGNYPCVLNIGTLNQHISGDHVLKPYLRLMSSMTKEECYDFMKLGGLINIDYEYRVWRLTPDSLDFLLSHHLDYRGLIEKELALEAPEGMY